MGASERRGADVRAKQGRILEGERGAPQQTRAVGPGSAKFERQDAPPPAQLRLPFAPPVGPVSSRHERRPEPNDAARQPQPTAIGQDRLPPRAGWIIISSPRNLALALVDQGNLAKALEHYAIAVRLRPEIDTSPTLHHLFAMNYAQARRFREAVLSSRKALNLVNTTGDQKLKQEIEKWLKVYEQMEDSSN